ncbi:hypothetical protein DPM13_00380 [Paracoccus mutanolyticus]|uniref:Uncharacterized protein n=1 Tax=Paracoccus mutanolyticus TaxID=1499308 RepID=A0ABM6WNV3_9RHOB|nr:hypothetical protein [Paracoccus mutanolyticus]AWX92275.1 hypothetical protein DPM13_00380 [Paracoccus mutanolyticus]
MLKNSAHKGLTGAAVRELASEARTGLRLEKGGYRRDHVLVAVDAQKTLRSDVTAGSAEIRAALKGFAVMAYAVLGRITPSDDAVSQSLADRMGRGTCLSVGDSFSIIRSLSEIIS